MQYVVTGGIHACPIVNLPCGIHRGPSIDNPEPADKVSRKLRKRFDVSYSQMSCEQGKANTDRREWGGPMFLCGKHEN